MNSNKIVYKCYTCNSKGFVNVRKKTGEVGEYVFSCDCVYGNNYPCFQKWHDSFQKVFTRSVIPSDLRDKFYGHCKNGGE